MTAAWTTGHRRREKSSMLQLVGMLRRLSLYSSSKVQMQLGACQQLRLERNLRCRWGRPNPVGFQVEALEGAGVLVGPQGMMQLEGAEGAEWGGAGPSHRRPPQVRTVSGRLAQVLCIFLKPRSSRRCAWTRRCFQPILILCIPDCITYNNNT